MALVESLSGVRGVYGHDLTPEVAYRYGRAFKKFLICRKKKKHALVIGMDTRPSGYAIKRALIAALDSDISDAGIAATPQTELAVRVWKADGGIMITASHNEPEWNGMKFLDENGGVLSEENMQQVITFYHEFSGQKKINLDYAPSQKVRDISAELPKAYESYVHEIIGRQQVGRIKKMGCTIIADPNGGAAISSLEIFKNVGISCIGINTAVGNFKRIIEPNQQSLAYLTAHIKKHDADFACGFDCDADRVELVLPSGKILSGNHLLALACQYYLALHTMPQKIVVVNDATSYMVRDVVENLGGSIIEAGVGEANVVAQIYYRNAVLGGEGSSAGVILPPSRCRDGTLTVFMILSMLAQTKIPLEELVKKLPAYTTLSKKCEINEKNMPELKKRFGQYYAQKGYSIVSNCGSVKVLISKNSFVWMRESKTESGKLRLITDAKTETKAQRLMDEAEKIVDGAL